MNSILNFAWQKFRVFEPSPSVSEALDYSRSVFPRGAVLYYKEARRSVVVFHDQLEYLVKAVQLPLHSSMIHTGILDVVGRGHMIVHHGVPALTVTRLVGLADVSLVLAVNDMGLPQGLFSPAWVRSRLPSISRVSVLPTLTLDKMVEAVDLQMPNFHSEQVNYTEHDLLWCSAGHLTSRCPCSIPTHQAFECGVRTVAV